MNFDAIVLGLGGVGSAAVCELSRRGLRTLGLEQFELVHRRGSSHGHTRVIRQAYFEHPDYVPLALRSYEMWRALECESETGLLHQIGLVEVGPCDGEVISGVREAAELHNLDIQQFSAKQAAKAFAPLLIPEDEDTVAIFEPAAGYLMVEECVAAFQAVARKNGATLLSHTPVQSWQVENGDVRVSTKAGEFISKKLVISSGAWSPQLIPSLRPIEVRLKHVYWFDRHPKTLNASESPIFLYDLPDGVFYGFPTIDRHGVKVAEHTGGTAVKSPDIGFGHRDAADENRVRQFASRWLQVDAEPHSHETCIYSMSSDGHFIVDQLNDTPRIAYATGLSGHGFKFTPALGQALADLVTIGSSELPIQFLSANRWPAS